MFVSFPLNLAMQRRLSNKRILFTNECVHGCSDLSVTYYFVLSAAAVTQPTAPSSKQSVTEDDLG